MVPLAGIRLLSLAINVPGPVAVARLVKLGARAIKIEPPSGDPLAIAAPSWYAALHENVSIERLDLKSEDGQQHLRGLLAESDLLISASRPASLERLGLHWPALASRYPQLYQVAIIGRSPPEENKAGHDLTYQAKLGLVDPPHMPWIMMADLAGAEQAVSAALALLLARQRAANLADKQELPSSERYTQVALEEAAKAFAAPLHYGLTAPGGLLSGSLPVYSLYRAADGWVALAALERKFMHKLVSELALAEVTHEALSDAFLSRQAGDWERWAEERDLPIVAVHRI